MTQSHEHRGRNLFNNEIKEGLSNKEGKGMDDFNGIDRLTSEQIKNANAAGMGALERSNEDQIKTENQVDREEGEAVY